MILKLNSYNFKLIFFSLIEKYSLSILQIIAILLITHYFGFISLGIIGSFSLIVSVFSGISEFGGSYGVIRSNKLSPIYITSSLFFSFIIGCLLYLILFFFTPLYLLFIDNSKEFIDGLRLYGILVVLTPVQIISFTALIKLEKSNKLTLINIISWTLSLLILFLVGFRFSFNPINVIYYFIFLCMFRMIGGIFLLHRYNMFSLSKGFKKINFSYHFSITGSNIFNSISANIWTYAVSNLVSLEANSILSLFTKLRDISSGNLSHGIHRVVFGKLAALKNYKKKNLIKKTITYFILLNTLILFLIALLNNLILNIFNYDSKFPAYLLYVFFPLVVGFFYPFTDTLKALARHNNQKLVIQIEFLTALILVIALIMINSILYLMLIFLIIIIAQSLIFNSSEKVFIK